MHYEFEEVNTGMKANVIEVNEKFKTVLLKLETGKHTTMTQTTFKKEWRERNGKN